MALVSGHVPVGGVPHVETSFCDVEIDHEIEAHGSKEKVNAL